MPQPGVEESWTSEFKAESVAESEDPSLVGSSMVHQHEDDAVCPLHGLISSRTADSRCHLGYLNPYHYRLPIHPRSPPRRRQSSRRGWSSRLLELPRTA